jgi:predicted  nucleic acid-binding Zn-ribbon protein
MSRWEPLLEVQEHDTTADQLAHRRRTLPARAELDAAMADLTALEGTVAEVDAERKELARAQQRFEDEIASLRAKAEQHDKTLYSGSIGNPRELQALQDEIAALQRRITHLEDQEIEVMEQLEPVEARLAAFGRQRAELDDRAAGLRAQIAEAEVEIDAELERVRSERGTAAATVEPDLLSEYEQLRPRTGGIGIARLVNGHCGGCHLALSAVEVDRIKHLPEDEVVHCEECGRLLAR